MDSTEQHDERTTTAELLARAQALAGEGHWQEALEAVRLVKEFEPQNIYVLAFERQIEQLIRLSSSRILTEEQREDIMESIPGIVERALDSPTAHPIMPPSAPSNPQKEKEEKAAALTWLKNQYFQQAHDFVTREEYAHALAEIRRVFIIEPDNATARQFEQHIEDLVRLQASQLFKKKESTLSLYGKESSQETLESRSARKRRLTIITIAAVVLIVVGIILGFALGRKLSATPPAAPADSATIHMPAPVQK